MDTELMIDINGLQTPIYMQSGFFNHDDLSCPLHKHPFAEVHVLLNGSAVLVCDKEKIVLHKRDVLIVPDHILHQYQYVEKGSKRITFFLDDNKHFAVLKQTTLPPSFLSLFCTEIQGYVLESKDGKLRALLSYICSDLSTAERKKQIIPMANRELMVETFFSKRYNQQVTLGDLSKELGLSHRQTEREVKRITGNTFMGELSKRRINAAVILLQTTDFSLAKISELVGYSTYCGFYKAYKRMTKPFEDTNIPVFVSSTKL